MPDFKFELQSVLQLRERDRDEAARALQQSRLAMRKLDDQVSELLNQHAAQQPLQLASGSGQINAQQLLESQRYQLVLLQEIKQLNEDKSRIEAEHARRRMVLVEKEQQVRSLEKLKERQLAKHQLKAASKEQDALDEWSGFHHWKSAIADNTPGDSGRSPNNQSPRV